MVQTLYQSFRNFVESEQYDPISYEKLLYGEVFDLVLIEGRETLARELAVRDRRDAHALIQTLLELAYEFKKGCPRRANLAEFLRMSMIYWEGRSMDPDVDDEQISELLGEAWNEWTVDQRSRYVEDELYLLGGGGGFGESLRKLRSPLVESWLKPHV